MVFGETSDEIFKRGTQRAVSRLVLLVNQVGDRLPVVVQRHAITALEEFRFQRRDLWGQGSGRRFSRQQSGGVIGTRGKLQLVAVTPERLSESGNLR